MQTKHNSSILLFFLLVFILSIPFWVLEKVSPTEILPGLPISALGAFTPALAALILTYHADRLAGALQLLRRSFDFRRIPNANWLWVILLMNPAIAVLAYIVIDAVSEPLPSPAPVTLAVFPMLVIFFIAGLGEEIGWSGYAAEPLVQRWGRLAASLVLGLVWAIWHFVPLVQAHRAVEWIAWWSVGTLSLRLIMTWIYLQSGKSVFAAAVFHAMVNLSWQLFPNNGSFYDPRVFGVLTLACAIIIYLVQWFLSSRKLQAA